MYQLTVEARDDNGSGNSATCRLKLIVRDVNDEVPKFRKEFYTGILEPNFKSLREPIEIEAYDEDATEPNNQIVYALERTTFSDSFTIDVVRGFLDVKNGVQLTHVGLCDMLATMLLVQFTRVQEYCTH